MKKLDLSARKTIYIAVTGIVLLCLLVFVIWKFTGNNAVNSGNAAFARYIEGYTTGTVSRQSSITIRLASEVNTVQNKEEDNSGLFRVSPSIKGKTVWVDARTVTFKPDNDLTPGEEYKVSFALGKITKVPDSLSSFNFAFKVTEPAFEVLSEGLKSQNSQSLDLMKLTGSISLADAETPENTEKILTARYLGKTLSIKWKHNTETHISAFTIDSIVRTANANKLELAWNGSPISSKKKDKLDIEVPAKGNFKVLDIRAVQDDEQYVLVQFSDPILVAQDLNGLIGISNVSDVRFSIDGSEVKVYAPDRLEGNYSIVVNEGVENINAVKIRKSVTANVNFENRLPAVTIPGKGTILPGSGKLTMPFDAVNLRAVDVTIIKIFENNIAQYLQTGEDGGSYELRRVGRPVIQKTISLTDDKSINLHKKNRFSLDIDQLLRTEPGAIYRVTIGFRKSYSLYTCTDSLGDSKDRESGINEAYYEGYSYWGRSQSLDEDDAFWDRYNNYYPEDYNWDEREDPCSNSYYTRDRWASRDLLASNIGLMAKRGTDNSIKVIATSILTAAPMEGVTVSILDYQQQVLQKAVTDANGFADLNVQRTPYLLMASKNEERGYLRMDDGSSLPLSRFDVDGDVVQKGMKGFIYGERGVWRPGDSIYVGFILEDKQAKLPPDHPVTLELYNPKGQLNTRLVQHKALNGFYTFRLKTDASAPTGNWIAKVMAGGAVFQKTLKIETVMPNRLKIDLDFAGQKTLGKGGQNTIKLSSRWLFGASVQGLKAKVEASLSPIKTTFPNFGDYTFDDPTRNFSAETQVLFDGNLDGQGVATFTAALDQTNNAPGMLRANFATRVFEPGGNFSIDNVTMPYSPFSSYVGVKIPPGDKLSGMLLTDHDQKVQLVDLSAAGKPLAGKRQVQVEFYKIQWQWWWDQQAENLGNFTQDKYNKLLKKEMVTLQDGRGEWTIRVNYPDWGRYLIRVTDLQSGHATGKTMYIDWPGWAQREQQNNPTEASMLSFTSDKKQYKVGDEVTLTIPSSDGGRGLISIENGSRVLDASWIDTKKSQTIYRFKVTDEMAPNVFVNISLLQPHAQTANDLPIRMYGVIPLLVDNPKTLLKPVITMPAVLKPESKSAITVSESTGKPMTYTIALVDEGLLDLTRFKTPDPHSSFYAREALGVKSWDLFDQVLGAWGGDLERLLSIGGDADANQNINPAKANRFEPVVKFMGPFTLKGGSKATHSFTLPRYVGSIRAMVIAGQDGAYGFAEKAVAVKKPLMLLATLPRVIGPDESFRLPVTVFAMDNSIKDVSLDVSASSGLVALDAKQTIHFDQPGEKLVYATIKSGKNTGIGQLKITARSGGKVADYSVEIDIRNPNPYITSVSNAELSGGAVWEQQIDPLSSGNNNKGSVELSALPPINLNKRLDYLIQYPYGCVEQTTSSVFPQLSLNHLTVLTESQKAAIDRNIKSGINRLVGFQLPDGGIGYWPGATSADEWGTNYAGHFMLEAEAKGFKLPAGFLSSWKRYERKMALNWAPNNYNFRGGDLIQSYRLYLLALAKAPEIGAMNRLREFSYLSDEAKWRLAAAYQLAGQPIVANQLIKGLSTDPKPYDKAGSTFGSDLRDRAMILETMIILGKKQNAVSVLQSVANALGSESWYSTQSTAYALLAVAKYAESTNLNHKLEVSYVLGGKSYTIKSDQYVYTIPVGINNGPSSLKVTNHGSGKIFIRVIRSGQMPAGENAPEINHPELLNMQVQYTNAKGVAIDPTHLSQGTDFVAVVTIKNTANMGTYENMALAQIFPSGWEIINTRLADNENANRSSPFTYQDIRDDRVLTYFNIRSQETLTYRILLNASYVGRYFLPSVSCEAMYDNRIQAINTGKWVSVE
ncbi:hypothetical protein SAMN05216436_12154 [bacterium A37T11]|nr:hypothetical protein SAMN05216436_12154 [bacterium A37T11]